MIGLGVESSSAIEKVLALADGQMPENWLEEELLLLENVYAGC